ncbi:hypothetical protein HMPREF9012_1855 [Bacteroidetes bacterium oral taxon 272 str. F0290]|nr:hypothetical protein HMPREF9012_1855 [Bacteroidetes bacterium oral taxon 272 str. F0290]
MVPPEAAAAICTPKKPKLRFHHCEKRLSGIGFMAFNSFRFDRSAR